jgi:nucleotide-binding universal stress UspA family protein
METIVVGVDGSEGALDALRYAVREAKRKGARLRVVAVWHVPPAAYGGVGFVPPYDPRVAFKDGVAESLDRAVESLGEEADGIEVERVLVEGHAAKVLLDAAREADLLVVGSRGLGGFTGLLLGSVSQECAHHAPCPIVIVPHDERRAEAARAS